MRRILLAATLCALAAASARADLVDQRLAAADAAISRQEAAAEGGPACAAGVTADDVRLDLSSGTSGLSESARRVLLAATRPWFERLYNARAFVAGSPAVCDELAPLGATVSREKIAGDLAFDLLCKTNYYEALMAKATMLHEPTMLDLCKVRNRVGDRDFKLDSLDVSCRIIAERKGTVQQICANLAPYYDNASIAQSCTRLLRYIVGDPTVCPLFGDELVHERCEGYVAFGQAIAGDDGPCEKSPHCMLMRGQAAAAAAIAEKSLVARACGVYARPEIRAERGAALAASAASLEKALAAAGAETSGRAGAAELDARLERAIRLELRARRLAELK